MYLIAILHYYSRYVSPYAKRFKKDVSECIYFDQLDTAKHAVFECLPRFLTSPIIYTTMNRKELEEHD